MISKKRGETSYKETVFGIIPRSKLILLEIEGIKKAWDFVLGKRKRGKISVTPDFIKKLHKTGFAWIFPKTGGKFRKIEVVVSKHTPPKFHLILQLLENYCQDIQIRLNYLPTIDNPDFLNELIELLTWIHHRFLWIHPFQDYNGRIGRLLVNVILLNLDLPPIELKVETKHGRKKYIESLQEADAGDYKKLRKIIESAIMESIEELEGLKNKIAPIK